MNNYLPKSLFFGLRFTIIALLLSLFLCSCEKEKVVVQGGSFSFGESKYSINKVKVEHVGYAEEEYLLRFLAYPAAYTVSETTTSGYGVVVDARFLSATKDFEVGELYQLVSDSSYVIVYPEVPKDTAIRVDTLYCQLVDGEIRVDSADGYRTFNFGFLTADGDSVVGSYLGDYTYNYILDQKGYGELAFDTISCQLAMPMMTNWGHLFTENSNYFEFTFYSTAARFTDAGKVKSGVQFVVGVHDAQEEYPTAGDYSVSMKADDEMSVVYGHKLNNTAWGTYWQMFYNGSSVGKANIVAGEAQIVSIDEQSLNMIFTFEDQLGNEVVGAYEGPYLRNRE